MNLDRVPEVQPRRIGPHLPVEVDSKGPDGGDVDAVAVAVACVTVADPAPLSARVRTLELLSSVADPLVRAARPGHITASALVVDPERRAFVLLHHAKLDIWVQPGGHVDGEGNLAESALREATEETGIEGLRVVTPAIDIDIHRVDPPREDAHDHHDVRYLVLCPPGSDIVHNEESLAARWVGFEEMDSFDLDESVTRLVRSGVRVLDSAVLGPDL